MRFSLDQQDVRYQITHYQPGQLTINHQHYSGTIVLADKTLISPWTSCNPDELTEADLQVLLDLKPHIILLGTGLVRASIHPQHIAHIQQLKIGIEVMDTRAACRTYQVLVSEGRAVVAGLWI